MNKLLCFAICILMVLTSCIVVPAKENTRELNSINQNIRPLTNYTLLGVYFNGMYITNVTLILSDGYGINYTMVKVDDNDWIQYTSPITITGNGSHTVSFYSVDLAGNILPPQTIDFTIWYPLKIDFNSGIGIHFTVENLLNTTLTVYWDLRVGGSLILLGKHKSDTVDIPPHGSITISEFILGFGSATLTLTIKLVNIPEYPTITKVQQIKVILIFVR